MVYSVRVYNVLRPTDEIFLGLIRTDHVWSILLLIVNWFGLPAHPFNAPIIPILRNCVYNHLPLEKVLALVIFQRSLLK